MAGTTVADRRYRAPMAGFELVAALVMAGFELLAALVGSLAWPLAVLIVALIFRHQLAALLARPFTHVKAGPFEVTWDREIAEVEAELESPPPLDDRPQREPPTDRDLIELATTIPRLAVLEAFARMVEQLRELLAGGGIDGDRGTARMLARRALDAGLIPPETMRAIEGLAALRNLAAHGRARDIDEGRALDYIAQAGAVRHALTQHGGAPEPVD